MVDAYTGPSVTNVIARLKNLGYEVLGARISEQGHCVDCKVEPERMGRETARLLHEVMAWGSAVSDAAVVRATYEPSRLDIANLCILSLIGVTDVMLTRTMPFAGVLFVERRFWGCAVFETHRAASAYAEGVIQGVRVFGSMEQASVAILPEDADNLESFGPEQIQKAKAALRTRGYWL